jgi:RNA 2',3'-cyclic 3'-phosphodiesterase
MRLFAAISLPPAGAEALVRAQAALRRAGAKGSFTRPGNFHLTLAFLGETEALAAARAAVAEACALPCGPLTLQLEGCGRFGDVWWAGAAPDPELTALALEVQGALRRRGFALEDRPFVPHVTLARRVRVRPAPELSLSAPPLRVERVSLLSSQRTEAGRPFYREVGAWPLRDRQL